MWGFDDCCSRCKSNDGIVFDHVAKKISCSDCGLDLGPFGLSIATTDHSELPPKDTSSDDFLTSDPGTSHNPSSHPVSVAATTTEPNNNASSDDDLGFDPLAVVTTQSSNASSDEDYRLIHLFYRLNLLATVKNQATEISEQIKGQITKQNVRFAASIYIACRQNGMALSIREISTVANGAEESKFTSAVKSVADKLGLTPQLMHIRAVEFAKRYSTDLEMDSQAVKAAEARRSVLNMLTDITEATELHENTIKETYKDLYPHLSKIIPKGFANAWDLKKLHSP
ncbi:unnamed protein product [Eruca vesicaria subsp. sativa]|uniref:Transcription factor TFIIB cyclin-like domain-containing protein n=1 Tax=Eruca vesicaria subsp. sativa TaxID=29727 RepID=A0ABC8LK33_ERUVS|nr:unnamed protein product [Eruca vesicaria subsp. sativa]